ncbi:MAG: flagellar biosynthesis protein FlhF [Campylobacterales bacterium]|nr:flagellar biosynthesis protein FlhF [Campylobacterales bacterium]
MINETFVASTPTVAYEEAIQKYGNRVTLVSARQIRYEDGKLRSEIVISVPKELFMQKSFANCAVEPVSEEALLLGEIEALKIQIQHMKEDLDTSLSLSYMVKDEVKELFMKKGIASVWLDAMFETLDDTELLEDKPLLVSYLLGGIDEALKVKKENLSSPKVMMLVGPTGSGKTTTIAKLAARYAYLMDRPYRVALVNLDTYKVGAFEQLEHYADIMQIEHVRVGTTDEFKESLERFADDYDIILVDTAGMSPYDTKKFIKTIEFVTADTTQKMEVDLVLPATVKYEDMEDIYKNFSFLNPESVIITKFDETKHFGTLLNFMLLYKLPMSYFSIGQEVPDDLIVADKEFLLEQFIGDMDEE